MSKKEEIEDEKMAIMDTAIKEVVASGSLKSVFDVQEMLKKSFGKVIQEMLETEMTEHIGHEKYEYTESEKENYRNGYSSKKVKGNLEK